MTALDGIRVVDSTSGIAGAVATMMLADFGADVVTVEPPIGAAVRVRPGFAMWGRNKRSIVVDPASASGQRRLRGLLAAADVWATDDTPPPASLEVPQPEVDNAALIRLALPAYTDRAPWIGGRESDPLLAAITGVALRQASFDGGPVDSIYPHLVIVQGIWAAAAAVAALVERERSGSGEGQQVTVGGVHGAMVAGAGAFTFDAGRPAAVRVGGPGGSVPFYRTYRCGDGHWLFLAALTPVFTGLAFEVLGLTDLFEDPRLGGRGRSPASSSTTSTMAAICGRPSTVP